MIPVPESHDKIMGRLQSLDWTHWTGLVDWNNVCEFSVLHVYAPTEATAHVCHLHTHEQS